MIEHRSLVNLCFWHNRYYRVTGQDRTIQYAAFGFDASVWEVFPYFLAGAEIHIISDAVKPDIGALREYFEKNRITIAFLPTQVSEQFMDTEQGREIRNHSLRKVLTGGDKLSRFIKQDYDLYNNYGPTENTVVTTAFKVEDYRDNIPIGNPIYNHRVYILNTGGDGLHLQPIGVPGELCITGAGVSRGYLNRPELTAEKFLFADYRSYKSYRTYISQKIYKTGDLARWMVDGNIQFLGRMDHQVKLRGYRIEPGEIEDRLLRHGHIEEAVVIDRKNRAGEIYLCAYIVVKAGEDSSSASRLREYLSRSLPAYMIPAYFVLLEKLPLNPSGKVDKKALPEPAAGSGDRDKYTAPRDEVEEKLAAIWAEVLGRDPSHPSIGIDDNFFERGGHSLKATILLAGIYKAFEVKVPMPELFRAPTIRELAKNIREAVKEGFHSIDSCEEREYYKVSSVQRRLFFLQQVNPDNMSYNIPMFLALEGEYDLERLEKALRGLIERHESLRTSFLSIEGEPVQRVHRPGDVEFTLEYHEFPGLLEGDARDFGEAVRELARPGSAAARVVDDFVRPFDLSLPPLMRLGLIVPDRRRLIFMIDIHHSISDGTSQGIFAGELIALYKGEEPAPLRLQYRDFSRWFDSEEHQRQIRQQENYWLKRFSGEIPLLNLPADFERPAVQTFEGASVHFDIGRDRLRALKKLAAEEEATLYIVMLAIFNVTLSRLTGGEDIIVGASLAGRRHPDLEKIIGMFINALALRNYPAGDKTFIEFLGEVKQNTIKDFENQDYQFENLVDRIAVERVPGRNPLFDAMMVLNNEEKTRTDIPGLKIGGFPSENKAAQMDLKLRLEEIGENLFCSFEYSTSLFKKETVGMFAKNIKEVLDRVMEDREVRIKDVKITHGLLSTKVDTSRMSFEF
jgi:non-ribosomal peptide synthetase component F/acyl carrier protein